MTQLSLERSVSLRNSTNSRTTHWIPQNLNSLFVRRISRDQVDGDLEAADGQGRAVDPEVLAQGRLVSQGPIIRVGLDPEATASGVLVEAADPDRAGHLGRRATVSEIAAVTQPQLQ